MVAAEVEEDLESSASPLIEELEGERLVPIEMAGLAEGKHRIQLPTANVHIQRFGADIEETVGIGEFAKLSENFDGCRSVRDNDMHIAQRFKRTDKFLPTGEIEFTSGIAF